MYFLCDVAIGTHLYTVMSIQKTCEIEVIVASRIADPFFPVDVFLAGIDCQNRSWHRILYSCL